jgi:hypothetical protein
LQRGDQRREPVRVDVPIGIDEGQNVCRRIAMVEADEQVMQLLTAPLSGTGRDEDRP